MMVGVCFFVGRHLLHIQRTGAKTDLSTRRDLRNDGPGGSELNLVFQKWQSSTQGNLGHSTRPRGLSKSGIRRWDSGPRGSQKSQEQGWRQKEGPKYCCMQSLRLYWEAAMWNHDL